MQLSKRLQAVADLAESCACAADVGTDHGYIPIYLVQQGIAEKAIAMDINRGPLERAAANICGYGLGDRITTRQSDGLHALQAGEAQCVIIAGMGGLLTIRILEEGREVLTGIHALVLQPQSELEQVRTYLLSHGYRICKENMVKDDGKFYPMMQVRPGESEAWQPEEYACGKYLIEQKNPALQEFLEKEERLCGEILASLKGRNGEHIDRRRAEVEEKLGKIRLAKERMR